MGLILNDPCDHNFGGSWTQEKLSILKQYMNSYMNVMKKQSYSLIYIDAFAGTGERVEEASVDESIPFLFNSEDKEQRKQIFDGSATISLNLSRPFDEYWFIEENQERFDELCILRNSYSHLNANINCKKGDANDVLPEILRNYDWRKNRSILFLDPYGANVSFQTLNQISAFKGLDIWLLFPLGQAVNRLLCNDPNEISVAWSEKLNRIFGCSDWRKEFYQKGINSSLFEQIDIETKIANWDIITTFYKKQLKKVFVEVAEKTYYLLNSKNVPLFAFIFAMTNPDTAARNAAMRISNFLLN